MINSIFDKIISEKKIIVYMEYILIYAKTKQEL